MMVQRNATRIKIDKMDSPFGKISGLDVSIGSLVLEDEEEFEPQGPTPMPSLVDLRPWYLNLMSRYKPAYAPICDMCCLCTYGKCNLAKGRTGACGIDIKTQQARIVEIACCIGASCHSSHGIHLLHWMIEKYGPEYPIDLGDDIAVEAPMARLICGVAPKTIGELEGIFQFIESQIIHLLSAAHTGQEAAYIDYEAKAMHAGVMDLIGMEAADLAQLVIFKNQGAETALVELGMGCVKGDKPNVLMIGHNAAPGIEMIDFLKENELYDKVEISAICCTAHDLTRYWDSAKVIGSMSRQLRFVRSGIPDVVMVDEQCIRTDIIYEAKRIKAAFVVTNEKNMLGLPDRTHDDEDKILDDLVNLKVDGVLILEPEKAGRIAVKAALEIHDRRKDVDIIPKADEMIEMASACTYCENCTRACPNDLPVAEAVQACAAGDFSLLREISSECLVCGRCEGECAKGVSPVMLIQAATIDIQEAETFLMRAGRGPVTDVEIRDIGAPVVLGEIPGVIAIVGCANYPSHINEVAYICDEFCKRGYIVLVSGCGAMDIALYRDEEGQTLYEKYSGVVERGCLVNVGSCVANAHITGTAAKVANIFARRPLRGNFEEIADYNLHRVGAVGLAWGAMSQKAASIATGVNAIGVPVIIGPHGAEYRRSYLGNQDDPSRWQVWNTRDGSVHAADPCPEHLIYAAESMEECIVALAKLCLRPADSTKGRSIKLSNWIDLHKKYVGVMPPDVTRFIRVEADIPITMKSEIMELLKKESWEPREVIDPTMVERLGTARLKK
ncbi:MAG: CO dehydrogenase/acetyl-CoA synthase complex subunit alpha [Candidatus Hodarchaeota archaeon]